MNAWSANDVLRWVQYAHLPDKVTKVFKEFEVSGKDLCELKDFELEEMGITRKLTRIRIAAARTKSINEVSPHPFMFVEVDGDDNKNKGFVSSNPRSMTLSSNMLPKKPPRPSLEKKRKEEEQKRLARLQKKKRESKANTPVTSVPQKKKQQQKLYQEVVTGNPFLSSSPPLGYDVVDVNEEEEEEFDVGVLNPKMFGKRQLQNNKGNTSKEDTGETKEELDHRFFGRRGDATHSARTTASEEHCNSSDEDYDDLDETVETDPRMFGARRFNTRCNTISTPSRHIADGDVDTSMLLSKVTRGGGRRDAQEKKVTKTGIQRDPFVDSADGDEDTLNPMIFGRRGMKVDKIGLPVDGKKPTTPIEIQSIGSYEDAEIGDGFDTRLFAKRTRNRLLNKQPSTTQKEKQASIEDETWNKQDEGDEEDEDIYDNMADFPQEDKQATAPRLSLLQQQLPEEPLHVHHHMHHQPHSQTRHQIQQQQQQIQQQQQKQQRSADANAAESYKRLQKAMAAMNAMETTERKQPPQARQNECKNNIRSKGQTYNNKAWDDDCVESQNSKKKNEGPNWGYDEGEDLDDLEDELFELGEEWRDSPHNNNRSSTQGQGMASIDGSDVGEGEEHQYDDILDPDYEQMCEVEGCEGGDMCPHVIPNDSDGGNDDDNDFYGDSDGESDETGAATNRDYMRPVDVIVQMGDTIYKCNSQENVKVAGTMPKKREAIPFATTNKQPQKGRGNNSCDDNGNGGEEEEDDLYDFLWEAHTDLDGSSNI
eukprot:m.130901 g.130901  ORF g.130901 m.130901 type:complete len:765 (+) comp13063_c0_seq1:64-2358(+)